MSTNFSLSSIIPESLTFTDDAHDGDGKVYIVRRAAEFNSFDFVAHQRLQADLTDSQLQLGQKDSDAIETMKVLERVADEFVRLLIPTMPEDRLKTLALVWKMAFIGWWNEQQPKAAVGGNRASRRTAAKTARGKAAK